MIRMSLLAVAAIMLSVPSEATLNFQRPSDILGVASLFEEGTSLPTRSFTISTTLRSSSGRNTMFMQRAGTKFYIAYWGTSSGLADVTIDATSYVFDLASVDISVEDAIMTTRTWSVTYDDAAGELALYIDTIWIGTINGAEIYPGVDMFGPAAIPYLALGSYTHLSYDDEGGTVLDLTSDTDGLFGTFDSLQLWDRALNASEVARLAVSPNSLTGGEEGLCLLWRADRGHGNRVSNLGSAGATYDGVLGEFAVGVGQTSGIFGSDGDTTSATSPMWVNKTEGLNSIPTAENATLQVSFCCGGLWGL